MGHLSVDPVVPALSVIGGVSRPFEGNPGSWRGNGGDGHPLNVVK